MKEKEIAEFLFELGLLKNFKRTGWWLAKVKDPESVSDHVHRASVLSYILGKMEGADASRCAMLNLMHDNHEARTLDMNKVAARYFDVKKAERKAAEEQLDGLPSPIKEDLLKMFDEYESRSTKEAEIARDADLLECAITAKEYMEQGYKDCKNWIDNVEKLLKTKSAKKIFNSMKKESTSEWYFKLKKSVR